MILRPYQEQAIQSLREGIQNNPKAPGLLVAPTGSGKSEIFGWMARSAVAKGYRVGAMVNRRILVNDLARRVSKLGLGFGLIMGGEKSKPWEPVQIASFDALWRRPHLPKWNLVFIDEAHYSLSDKYGKVIQRLEEQNTTVIGMTATPVRGVGEGLGATYKWMVRCPDTPDLIDMGFLVRPRVFNFKGKIDLTGVGKVAGEFNQRELAVACDKTSVIGDALEHWQANGRGRPTIGFGVDIKHCKHLAETFCAAGVRAIAIDHAYKGDFDLVWRKLANYETEVVFNVGIAGIGWDCPPCSCLIDLRPTQSVGLAIQHWGRVMRICEGKQDAIINDHASNTLRHGLPDWPRDWQLNGTALTAADIERVASVATCKKCYLTFEGWRRECPGCGLVRVVKGREVEVLEGKLEEVKATLPPKPLTPLGQEQAALYKELLQRHKQQGKPESKTSYAYYMKTKQWPTKAIQAAARLAIEMENAA